MKKKRIVLDVDDVLFDLLQLWVDVLNAKYGLSVKVADIKAWEMESVFPTLTHEEIHAPLVSRSFWEQIQPIEGSIKYVSKLIEDGYIVYLCTASNYRNIKYKVEMLQHWFPMIPTSRIMTSRDKSLIACDIMVDDAIHNLTGKHMRHKILFDAPYNQNGFDVDNVTKFRVYNWDELYTTICEIMANDIDDAEEIQDEDLCQWEFYTGMNINKERVCQNCKEHIFSSHWSYCPSCGSKMREIPNVWGRYIHE